MCIWEGRGFAQTRKGYRSSLKLQLGGSKLPSMDARNQTQSSGGTVITADHSLWPCDTVGFLKRGLTV